MMEVKADFPAVFTLSLCDGEWKVSLPGSSTPQKSPRCPFDRRLWRRPVDFADLIAELEVSVYSYLYAIAAPCRESMTGPAEYTDRGVMDFEVRWQ